MMYENIFELVTFEFEFELFTFVTALAGGVNDNTWVVAAAWIWVVWGIWLGKIWGDEMLLRTDRVGFTRVRQTGLGFGIKGFLVICFSNNWAKCWTELELLMDVLADTTVLSF